MPPSSVPKRGTFKQTFAQALALPLKAVWNEIERIYSEVLTHRPDHFNALQMLSVIKLAIGQPADTLRLISQAVRMRSSAARKHSPASKFAEPHNNRGAVLSALGRMPRRSAAAIKRSR